MKKQSPPRIKLLLSAAVLVASVLFPVLTPSQALAANDQITARDLTLMPGTTDGGSAPGGDVVHQFNFTLNNTTDQLGSMTFQYCTTAAAVSGGTDCEAPTGVDVSGATLDSESGATGFTTLATSQQCDTVCSDNTVTLGRASTTTLVAATPSTYEFSGVINPTTANETFFVRVTTYTTLDGSTDVDGLPNDNGTVAASTAEPIDLTGTMPESLVFCTGATVGLTAGVPDCTTATAGDIEFDKLFTPQDTAFATSQMSASTNAGSGYIITVAGPTLTSGGNSIGSIGDTAEQPILGKVGGQFGLNLVENTGIDPEATVVPDSADVAPAANATNYFGQALTNFATDSSFAFDPATVGNPTAINSVADSDTSGTDAQIYTVSYIVNVPGSQPAGTYTTTLTYIATAYF
jgi:hypothetical protein